MYVPPSEIHRFHPAEMKTHIRTSKFAEFASQREADARGVQSGGSNLIEKRRKRMIVILIYHNHTILS